MEKGIRNQGNDCVSFSSADTALSYLINETLLTNTIFIFMSNGSMDLLDTKFVKHLDTKYANRLQSTNN